MINLAVDFEDVFNDFASCCEIESQGGGEPYFALLVVRGAGSGRIDSRNALAHIVDVSSLPRGADFGYGLMWADDAPVNMNPEAKITIRESTGDTWMVEAARPIYDVDPSTRQKRLVVWRLVLRGKQRMVRGK